MAFGNEIIIVSEPKGTFIEGIISGTPKPGTCMEVTPSTSAVSGDFTYRVSSMANGRKRLVMVLLNDALQGRLATDAYTTGTRGQMYCPLPGEDLNMLVKKESGTGTLGEENIGDLLQITSTGLLEAETGSKVAGTEYYTPFTLMEHGSTAFSGDTLMRCRFNG